MKKRLSYICALSLALSALTACDDEEDKPNNPETELDAGIDVTSDAGTDVLVDAGTTSDAGTEEKITPMEISDLIARGLFGMGRSEYECGFYSSLNVVTEAFFPLLGQTGGDLLYLHEYWNQAYSTFQNSLKEGRQTLNEEALRCFYDTDAMKMLTALARATTTEELCSDAFDYFSHGDGFELSILNALEKCIGNGLEEDALSKFWLPTVNDGDACALNVECLSGRCVKAENSCEGTCTPKLKEHEVCAYDLDCEGNMTCTYEGDAGVKVCVARHNLSQGLNCNDSSECEDSLECREDKVYGMVCSGAAPIGEECAGNYYCETGLFCRIPAGSGSGTCQPFLKEGEDCSNLNWSTASCASGLYCQRTGGTSSTPVETCVSLKGVGEACALEVDTHNNTCLSDNADECSPEGICIESFTRKEGQVCRIKHEDNTTTYYGCEPGYDCSKTTDTCVKKAAIGEVCMYNYDCFDVDSDPFLNIFDADDEDMTPFRMKGMKQTNKTGASSNLPTITSVRCVADALENRRICQEVKDVGGACMAKFSSPESGCKLDLICMPNESGADENGFTGKCQRAPGLNETCATHEAYEGYLCDAVTSAPTMTTTTPGEVSCICGPKKTKGEPCQSDYDCIEGLFCDEECQVPGDLFLNTFGCQAADNGILGIID